MWSVEVCSPFDLPDYTAGFYLLACGDWNSALDFEGFLRASNFYSSFSTFSSCTDSLAIFS